MGWVSQVKRPAPFAEILWKKIKDRTTNYFDKMIMSVATNNSIANSVELISEYNLDVKIGPLMHVYLLGSII